MCPAASSSPLVSICLPTFNGANYFESTLDSINNQTYRPIEMVIIDDGSTDNTVNIARRFKERARELSIVLSINAETLGMAGNWNETINRASGEYLKIMGQDDLLEPKCIQRQVECLDQYQELSMVTCARKIIRPNGKILFNRALFKRSQILDGIKLARKCLDFGGNFIGEPVAVMARAHSFKLGGGFDRQFSYYIDVDMWIKILKTGEVYYESQPLCGFRIHQGSVTFNIRKRIHGELEALRQIYSDMYTPPKNLLMRISKRVKWEFFVTARNLVYFMYGLK